MKTNTKLTATQVIDIRRQWEFDTTTTELARSYNVTPRTIQRIINRSMWASIPEDVKLDNYGGNYALTYDGRVWSYTKGDYIKAENGKVRITYNGKKVTLNVSELLTNLFD